MAALFLIMEEALFSVPPLRHITFGAMAAWATIPVPPSRYPRQRDKERSPIQDHQTEEHTHTKI